MDTKLDVDLEPLPGWSRFSPSEESGRLPSFVSGEPDGNRLRVRYFRRDQDQALVGKVWFGPGAVGPPGHAHGGSMAAVLDEAMGGAAWLAGHQVLAARLSVNFLKMLPLGTVAVLDTRVGETEGRKVRMHSTLSDSCGVAFCEAEGLFIEMDRNRHAEVLEKTTEMAIPIAPRGGRS